MPEVILELGARRALLTIDRPEVRNAISIAAMGELESALSQLEEWHAGHPLAVGVIVTGAGRAFVSGGDLGELQEIRTYEEALAFSARMQSILNRLEDLPLPVIAAVNGPAVGGGCEMALACDLRVMAEDAFFSFAQAKLAVVTGWGGAGRLADLIGWRRSLRLLASGSRVAADQAESMGLTDELAPPGHAVERAEALLTRLTELPPLAVRALKPLLRRVACLDRDEGQLVERTAFARLWTTEDHAEAISALLERREAHFQGR